MYHPPLNPYRVLRDHNLRRAAGAGLDPEWVRQHMHRPAPYGCLTFSQSALNNQQLSEMDFLRGH